jgi:hypothetical protein
MVGVTPGAPDGGRSADPPGDGDPLLVRPYIIGTAADPAGDRPAETWPEPAAAPGRDAAAPGSRPAAPQRTTAGGTGAGPGRGTDGPRPVRTERGGDPSRPATAVRPHRAGGSPADRRRRIALLLVGGVTGAVAVAGTVAAVRPDDDGPAVTAGPLVTVPTATPTTAPPEPAASGTSGPWTAPAAAAERPGTGSAPPDPARRTSAATAAPSAPAAGPGPGASAVSTPPPAAVPRPIAPTEAERAGAITGPGGRCLDVVGDGRTRGHRLHVQNCDGSAAQTWTLPADGTLRTGGRCGQPTEDGSVKLLDCDGRAIGQWRRGGDGTLVNVGTGNCLTDPDNGERNGSEVRVRSCDGGAAQQWSVP